MLKKDLEIQLNAANKLITDQRESIEKAARTNIAVNKQLQDDQSEVRRLRKVLDHAITTTSSRLATIRYVQPFIPPNICESHHDCCDGKPETIAEPQQTEEQKFLMFMVDKILYDQYKPENKNQIDNFFSGDNY